MEQRIPLKVRHVTVRDWALWFIYFSSAYISEVESAIDFVRRSPDISLDEKRRFFKSANRNVGSSALCLSGGATFGYCKYLLRIICMKGLSSLRSLWRRQGASGCQASPTGYCGNFLWQPHRGTRWNSNR